MIIGVSSGRTYSAAAGKNSRTGELARSYGFLNRNIDKTLAAAVTDSGKTCHKIGFCIIKGCDYKITEKPLRGTVGVIVPGGTKVNVCVDKAGHDKAVRQVDDLIFFGNVLGAGDDFRDGLAVDNDQHVL